MSSLAAATAYKRVSPAPRLSYKVFPNTFGVSHAAAQKALDLAKTGRGTVLTPGCNTPREMYQILSMEGAELFPALLRGEKGDFHMGMIDGVEWQLEHPYSFRHYFIQQFLGAFAGEPLNASMTAAAKQAAIVQVYRTFKNVFVPHLPKDGKLIDNMAERVLFSVWVMQRSPIDLGIFGLGPDHLAFLGPGTERQTDQLPAARVPLWGDIRNYKWTAASDGACACTRLGSCDTKREAPEHALTISLETALNMKEIVVMAMGQNKAETVRRLLYGEYEPERFSPHFLAEAKGKVTVLLDEAAASLI